MSGSAWCFHDAIPGNCRFIMPDLRGHGLSSTPADSGYSLEDFASDLVEFFVALSLNDVILAGWSMGAQVVLQAFPLLRARLSGLVLVSGTPRFTAAEGYPHGLAEIEAKGLGLLLQRDFEKAVHQFIKRMFTPEEITAGSHLKIVEQVKLPERVAARRALKSLAEGDLRNSLAAIDLPVLLIHGGADTICLPSASQYMADQLPNARLEVMEGAGHAPFLANPASFMSLLTNFIGQLHA